MNKIDIGNLRESTTVRQFKGANRVGSSIKDKTAHRTIAANLQAAGGGKPTALTPEGNPPGVGPKVSRDRPSARRVCKNMQPLALPWPLWAVETLKKDIKGDELNPRLAVSFRPLSNAHSLGCSSLPSCPGSSSGSPSLPGALVGALRAGPGMTSTPLIRLPRLRPCPRSPRGSRSLAAPS